MEYSWEDIKKHATREDLWFVIEGKVYNVTSFLDDHPGGDEVLKDVAGTDATQEFKNVSHSKDALEMLKLYEIGTLKGSVAKNNTETKTVEKKAVVQKESESSPIWIRLLAPFLIIAFALFLKFYLLDEKKV